MRRIDLEPIIGESLDGYLAFRAERMGLPNIGELAELVGIDHPAQSRISRSPEPLDDIADLLETPLGTLSELALPPAEQAGRRLLNGASISVRHLERVRRVSAPAGPAALGQLQAAEPVGASPTMWFRCAR